MCPGAQKQEEPDMYRLDIGLVAPESSVTISYVYEKTSQETHTEVCICDLAWSLQNLGGRSPASNNIMSYDMICQVKICRKACT